MVTLSRLTRVTPILVFLSAAMISLVFSKLHSPCSTRSKHITERHPESKEAVAEAEDGDWPRCPAVFFAPAVERHLQDILHRCDGDRVAFQRRRAVADRFMDTTLTQLRSLSPLLATATLLRLGSAYEGTTVSQAVDFDGFVALNESLLRPFELEHGEEGLVAARLRQDVTRESLPAELLQLLTADGYLGGRSFKRWALAQLEVAIRLAAAEHPELRVAGRSRKQVAEAELVSEEGKINVDFSVMVATPEVWRALRPAALRPCGIDLAPADQPPRWYLYSGQYLDKPPTEKSARWFTADALPLEQDLLLLVPRVREVTRLVKAVSAARRWDARFRIQSATLKQAVLWTYAAGCDHQEWQVDSALVPPVAASFRIVLQALRRGRLDCFWAQGSRNKLRPELADDGERAMGLINEVKEVINILASGDLEGVQRLFQSACQYRPFWKPKVNFE